MPRKNGSELSAHGEALPESQPTLWDTFRYVYVFILQEVKGDKATADAIFEDYLAGNLSEELLSISRRCVSADRGDSSNRNIEEGWRGDRLRARRGDGVHDDALSTAVA